MRAIGFQLRENQDFPGLLQCQHALYEGHGNIHSYENALADELPDELQDHISKTLKPQFDFELFICFRIALHKR